MNIRLFSKTTLNLMAFMQLKHNDIKAFTVLISILHKNAQVFVKSL